MIQKDSYYPIKAILLQDKRREFTWKGITKRLLLLSFYK